MRPIMVGGRRFDLTTAWPAVLFALAYLWAFPYFGAMKSANELPRLLLTEELIERGRLDLDARLGELGSRFDIATAPDGHHYSNKAPGVSLLGAPVYAVAHAVAGRPSIATATWLLRVSVVTLPCLGFLWIFWRVARRFAGEPVAARRALVAYGLGSLALPYAILFFSHALAGAAAGGAFAGAIRLTRARPARRGLLCVAVGLLAGGAVLIDYQALLAALAVGAYLLVRSPRRLADVGLAAVGALVPLGVLMAYHAAAFGAPWRTGYAFAADPAHRQGVLGIIGPNTAAMWNALLSPSNGLLVLSPWVVLAAVGAWWVARDPGRRAAIGAETATAAAIALAYLLFIGSLVPAFGRAGWSVGPRYIGVAMPFVGWLAAAGFAAAERRRAFQIASGALLAAAVVIHVVAAASFPHWPDRFANPVHEVSLRAFGEGLAPHSVGSALGLGGPLGLAPLFLAALALLAWALDVRRDRLLATGLAAVLGVGVVLAYRGFPPTPAQERERMWRYVRSVWEPLPSSEPR